MADSTSDATSMVSKTYQHFVDTQIWSTYTKLRTLGRGGFGVVYAARDKNKGRAVAVKIFKPKPGCEEGAFTEYSVMQALGYHPRLARLERSLLSSPDQSCHALVLQLYNGQTLWDLCDNYLIEGLLVPSSFIWHVFVQMIEALAFMHWGVDEQHPQGRPGWHAVIHSDIKPDNIVLHWDLGNQDSKGSDALLRRQYPKLKLIDFGVSVITTDAAYDPLQHGGAKDWRAPDLFQTVAWDVFTMGSVLHHLCFGTPPAGPTQIARAARAEGVQQIELTPTLHMCNPHPCYPAKLSQLIISMCTPNLALRPTTAQLYHQWRRWGMALRDRDFKPLEPFAYASLLSSTLEIETNDKAKAAQDLNTKNFTDLGTTTSELLKRLIVSDFSWKLPSPCSVEIFPEQLLKKSNNSKPEEFHNATETRSKYSNSSNASSSSYTTAPLTPAPSSLDPTMPATPHNDEVKNASRKYQTTTSTRPPSYRRLQPKPSNDQSHAKLSDRSNATTSYNGNGAGSATRSSQHSPIREPGMLKRRPLRPRQPLRKPLKPKLVPSAIATASAAAPLVGVAPAKKIDASASSFELLLSSPQPAKPAPANHLSAKASDIKARQDVQANPDSSTPRKKAVAAQKGSRPSIALPAKLKFGFKPRLVVVKDGPRATRASALRAAVAAAAAKPSTDKEASGAMNEAASIATDKPGTAAIDQAATATGIRRGCDCCNRLRRNQV